MAAFRFAQLERRKKELPPACSQECIWYEPEENEVACINRHEIICQQHRLEIFKPKDK